MKNISKKLPDSYIINFIKQNILNIMELSQEEIDDIHFVFSNLNDNYLQCLIIGAEQVIMRYNDYNCEIDNINGNSLSLKQPWRDFMIACMSGKSNDGYSVISHKDCIASYMLDFETNIVANSETQKWSNFLQNYMTQKDKKIIVLSDSDSIEKFRNQEDELFTPLNNAYMLNDDKEIIDVSDYLFSTLDDKIFDEFVKAQNIFSESRNQLL